MKPKKIDLYILGEVITPFLGGIVFFSFIFLMFQAVRIADSLIVHGAPLGIVLKITGLMAVGFLPVSLPIAFLLSILVGFGRLSSDSELVAMKANGISLQRMTLPVIPLAFAIAIISGFLNVSWVPRSDREMKRTFIRLTNTKAVSAVKEGTFTSGFFDLLVFADKVDTKTDRMQRVFIYDERDPNNPLTVIAREGETIPVRAEGDDALGSSVALKLYEGSIHSNQLKTSTYQKVDFETYQLFLKVDAGTDDFAMKSKYFTLGALRSHIEQEKDPRTKQELKTEYWRRLATALAPLLFVWIGVGFGTVRTRVVRAGAPLITVGTLVPYWILMAIGIKLGSNGAIPPILGANLPNIGLLFAGWRAYRSALW